MAKSVVSAVAPVQVAIQTMRESQGFDKAFDTVQKAVKAHNAANPKQTAHVAVRDTVQTMNSKGMQFALALAATLARINGATMVRLGVHGGEVAYCGTPESVKATRDAMVPARNYYATLVNQTYDASAHGNKVGFENGFLCGCPAGLQVAANVTATLAYGVGFLFNFPVTGDGKGYAIGQSMAHKAGRSPWGTIAPRAPRAPRAGKSANASEQTASEQTASEQTASVA